VADDERIAKIRGQAEQLLDLFIALREKLALLRPLAFDPGLAQRVDGGPRARGYLILRNTLLQGCVQDLVKVALDLDPRTPSVVNLVAALEDTEVRGRLLADYAVAPTLTHVGPGDPPPPEAIEEIRSREQERLAAEFETVWTQFVPRWTTFKDDQRLTAFKTWRDKLIAHAELHHTAGKYHLVDLATLGLKWGDVDLLAAELQNLVESIGVLTRGASFAWQMLDRQLDEASSGFWDMLGRADEAREPSN
jgi:hypothetical protein